MSGYSVLVLSSNGNSVIDKIISPLFMRDKSDRMELMALREALRWLKDHNFMSAVIFSDSQFVIDGYNKKLNNWIGNGFLDTKYIEVWKSIAELKQKLGNKVYVEKIKAHQKRSNWNNEADKLAKIASSPTNPNKAVAGKDV
jgi:ribonuclease HI